MITELKTYRITCDLCQRTLIMQDDSHPNTPDGWRWVDSHGHGAYDYTKRELICFKCSENEP